MIPLLSLRKVSKHFGDDFALEDIDLDLQRGEVHVLIGENGSGKSALMKVIAGQYVPDGGILLQEGRPLRHKGIAEARKAGILYLAQETELFDNLSVAENLLFNRMSPQRGLEQFRPSFDPLEMRGRAVTLFRELGIPLDPCEKAGNLGWAQKRLLEVARTFIGDWKVVILDEPSAAMSDSEREILYSGIRSLKAKGTGIFYISHRLDEALIIGDRISMIDQGRLVSTRNAEDLDEERLIELMTGTVQTERYPYVPRKRGKPVLEAVNLASPPALSSVSFTLHQGEIVGIAGLMGSGRTRLAECLSGAVQPTNGSLRYHGREVAFRDPGKALEAGIALLPEDRFEKAILHRQDLMLNVTVSSLDRFTAGRGLDRNYMDETVRNYARLLSMHPSAPASRPDVFSGGNQQKVALARALSSRAEVYLLDEPTRGIDVSSKVDICNAIMSLAVKGASILLISSDFEEMLGLCDRILVLSGGRIACDIPREKASQETLLRHITHR